MMARAHNPAQREQQQRLVEPQFAMLWVDKHRPTDIKQLDIHEDLTTRIQRMADPDVRGDLPHLMMYGPSGAGKKTRVIALLREIYGPGAEKLRVEARTFKISGGKVVDNEKAGDAIELNIISSNYHVELNPSDVGTFKDRLISQAVIKEIAQAHNPTATAAVSYKIIVINEVDRLSRDAQAALRRTMEKYTTACRFVFLCTNPCRVIDPVRSRCVCLRVPAPTQEEIIGVLQRVATKESITLPDALATRIAQDADGNLRRALLSFESCRVKQTPLSVDQAVERPDWERFIAEVASEIIKEQSPQRLLMVRGKLYELLTNCIPPDLIIKRLTVELLKKCDGNIKADIVHWAAHFEARLHKGTKPIFHIEAFIAKFMALFKKEMLAMFDDDFM